MTHTIAGTPAAGPNNGKTLRILQLYPKDMNIYGDWGNTLSLARRAHAHGFDVDIIDYNPGDEFPQDIDIIIGGGGQDSGQTVIQEDLHANSEHLKQLAEDGTPAKGKCSKASGFSTPTL